MSRRTVGIAMNGVTGRMGMNQHLIRSIVAIRERGGVRCADGTVIWPEPVLVGRRADELERLAREYGIARWTTDLDAAIADPECEVVFDAATTSARPGLLEKAVRAGKHVYCEKPLAPTLEEALHIARLAREHGVKNGIVHDKLFLPGFLKLRRLVDSGFFGRILSVRGEFGYWVFEGTWGPAAQRPSWNYRVEDGGGIMLDMFCHWSYVREYLIAPVRGVYALGATHIPERVDESAFAGFKLIRLERGEELGAGIFPLGDGRVLANMRYRTSLDQIRRAGIAVESIDLYEFGKVGMTPANLILALKRA